MYHSGVLCVRIFFVVLCSSSRHAACTNLASMYLSFVICHVLCDDFVLYASTLGLGFRPGGKVASLYGRRAPSSYIMNAPCVVE